MGRGSRQYAGQSSVSSYAVLGRLPRDNEVRSKRVWDKA